MSGTRTAFSLLELLVVIGLIAMLMGLTVGGIVSMRRVDRLVATERLVGDLLRQARHTARSTGQPVVLSFSKDRREIVGVQRVPVFTETFDSGTGADGLAGGGLVGPAPSATPADLFQSATDSSTMAWVLPRRDRLVRAAAGENGVLLSCAFRLPQGLTGIDLLPLVAVGPRDADPAMPRSDYTDPVADRVAIAGMQLELVRRLVQQKWIPDPITPTTLILDPAGSAYYENWVLTGWVKTSGGLVRISSELDAISASTLPEMHATTADKDAVLPIQPARWFRSMLAMDGDRLTLYLDDERVASATTASGARLVAADPAAEQAAYAGVIRTDPGTGLVTQFIPETVTLDDVAVLRLAGGEAGRLPQGVAPAQDFRVTVHPGGQVESPASMAFTAIDTPNGGGLSIVVQANGGLVTTAITGVGR